MTGEFDDGGMSALDNAMMWVFVSMLIIGGMVLICLE